MGISVGRERKQAGELRLVENEGAGGQAGRFGVGFEIVVKEILDTLVDGAEAGGELAVFFLAEREKTTEQVAKLVSLAAQGDLRLTDLTEFEIEIGEKWSVGVGSVGGRCHCEAKMNQGREVGASKLSRCQARAEAVAQGNRLCFSVYLFMQILTFVAWVLTLGSLQAGPVRVVGFDLLGPRFKEELAAFSRASDVATTVQMQGTRLGWQQLQQGAADLGLFVFAREEAPPGADFIRVPVAYITAVVVVPAGLPLSHLTLGDVASIYAERSPAEIKRWEDLSVRGTWAVRNIQPSVVGRQGGLTFDLFKREVLDASPLRPTVTLVKDAAEALERLSLAEGGGIAVVPLPPGENKGMRAVPLARSPGDAAYEPSPENLHSGDYPVRLALQLVFRRTDARELDLIVRFLLSEEMAWIWEQANLVPLPTEARNQQIFDLEML